MPFTVALLSIVAAFAGGMLVGLGIREDISGALRRRNEELEIEIYGSQAKRVRR